MMAVGGSFSDYGPYQWERPQNHSQVVRYRRGNQYPIYFPAFAHGIAH
jgi:hypothetical protein